MKKVLLIGSILAVASTVALANPVPYVGGSIGITNNTTTAKFHDWNSTLGSYRGVPFNVFAGYGGVIDQNFYLAGELGGTVGTANISKNDKGLKTTYSLGASVLPGIALGDHSLVYARAGIVRTRFTDSDKSRNGGVVGLGLQTALTQNIDIRTEYDFVAYKAINTPPYDNSKKGSFSPRSDQFNVGLVYKFD